MRRGQITLFIILGIVLVAAFAIFLYIQFATTTQQTDLSTYSPPSTPLQQYVASCLQDVSKKGLMKMGLQGGYIDMPPEVFANPYASFAVAPGFPVRTPLWRVNGQILAPTLEQMEGELEQYVVDNILTCLDNFSVFEGQQVQGVDQPRTTVQINAQDIQIGMDYDVISVTGDRQIEQDQFVISVPLALNQIYQDARYVSNQLLSSAQLEELTIHLMAASDPDIPMTGIKFTCETPIWQQQSVQQRLQEILSYNIARIRIDGTPYVPFEQDEELYADFNQISMGEFESQYCGPNGCQLPEGTPSDQFEYNHQFFNLGLDTPNQVALRYEPEFGMLMVPRPANNGIMKGHSSEGNQEFLKFFCMHMYHFTYDVWYPVEVSIVQETAFWDGDDFVFRFGVPVTIVKNTPSPSSFSSDIIFPLQENEDFCSSPGDEVNIFVYDAFNQQRINDAQIDFNCIKFTCDLGTTRQELNGVYRLQTNIPAGCAGGTLVAQKTGYTTEKARVNADTVEIFLKPLGSILYRVDFSPIGTNPIPLQDGQTAYVTIENEIYSESFVYDPTKTNYLNVLARPDEYEISVMVYEDQLIGGYIGTLEILEENAQQTLTIHAFEQPPALRNPEGLIELLNELKEEKEGYGPVWQ